MRKKLTAVALVASGLTATVAVGSPAGAHEGSSGHKWDQQTEVQGERGERGGRGHGDWDRKGPEARGAVWGDDGDGRGDRDGRRGGHGGKHHDGDVRGAGWDENCDWNNDGIPDDQVPADGEGAPAPETEVPETTVPETVPASDSGSDVTEVATDPTPDEVAAAQAEADAKAAAEAQAAQAEADAKAAAEAQAAADAKAAKDAKDAQARDAWTADKASADSERQQTIVLFLNWLRAALAADAPATDVPTDVGTGEEVKDEPTEEELFIELIEGLRGLIVADATTA